MEDFNTINGISILINRTKNIFQEALSEVMLQKKVSYTHPVIFTYFDTYNNQHYPKFPSGYRVFKLIERKDSNYISDKKKLGELVALYQLGSVFAITHFNIEDAINAYKEDQNLLLAFIKNRFGTAGKEVRCIHRSQLQSVMLKTNEIIQEGVKDIDLINLRKVTIRFYTIIYNKNIYLSKYAWAMINGAQYEKTNPNYKIQIEHEGYINESSKIKMIPLEEIEKGKTWLEEAFINLETMKIVFQKIMIKSSQDNYIILGIDAIPQRSNKLKFVEINTYPNFFHTDNINKKVNIPMLKCLLNLLINEDKSDNLLQVNMN